MTVHEVKEAARGWVQEFAAGRPGFAGAHLGGSSSRMRDEEPFPGTSDVDLHIVIDGPVPDSTIDVTSEMRQQKVLHGGIVIDLVYSSLSGITAEGTLRSAMAAPTFTTDCILSDPTGVLERVREAVTAEFAHEKWIRARCSDARGFAQWTCEALVAPPAWPGWKPELISAMAFTLGTVPSLAAIPTVACLGGWTFKRCLARCRDVLQARRRGDLYDSLLDLVGCRALSASRIRELFGELSESYDLACRVIRTPFWGDLEIQQEVRVCALGGCEDLISQGLFREAVPGLLYERTVA